MHQLDSTVSGPRWRRLQRYSLWLLLSHVTADGQLDVLVGDSLTLVELAVGLTKEEFDKKQAQWQKDFRKVSQEYVDARAAGDQDKLREAREKTQELNAKRSEFIVEDRTGFVWLYLKK